MPQPFSSRTHARLDPFQERAKQLLEWISTHRQLFSSIFGTVAVAGIVTFFIIANFRNLRKQAWERYSNGQNWANANNPDNALNFFNEVIKSYSHTSAAIYSLLAKGDLLYQQRKFSEAIESYKQCLEKKPKRIILPFVLSGLGAAQEDNNDFLAAIATYKQFVTEFPDHYFAAKIYESLARVYELSLNPEAAKEVYEKMIMVFPNTFWSEKATVRYHVLAPQPFQKTPTRTNSSSSKLQ